MLGERGRDVCFAEEEKEKTREAGLTTRVGRNAIYPVVKGSTLFISGPLKLLSAFVRTKAAP